jgi:hypothetical protein
LEEGGLSKFLIAIKLSVYIVAVELIGITSKRGMIAIISEREESGEGLIAALNLIDGSFSQIQPMLDCMFEDWRFLIEASVAN